MPKEEYTPEITDNVLDIFASKFGIDKSRLSLETSILNDLQADSLDVADITMELEEKFGLTIPDEDVEKIQTIGDAVEYIQDYKKKT